MRKIIIAVDGHSSCGKSTFAKLIAREYGYKYIDTGAMYRAVTLSAMDNNCFDGEQMNTVALIGLLDKINLDFSGKDILLNGVNVENRVRSMEVSNKVSLVSCIGEVRSKLISLQQAMGDEKGIVMDGRDIGTTVFPKAELKIFMTASVSIRAERRRKEYEQKGEIVSIIEIERNIAERDRIDETREVSPLRRADDALLLDNSNMTVDEQMEWVRGQMLRV